MKTKIIRIGLRLLVLVALLVGLTGVVEAQQRGSRQRQAAQPPQRQAQAEESQEEKPAGPITAIVGGRIHTVTREVIREGTILVQDGKILRVGQDLAIPEGAEVIDAAGKEIVPGFISLNASGLGLSGTPSGQNRAEDALNPFDRNMQYLLGVGVTTVCSSTGSAGGGRRGGSPAPMGGGSGFASTGQIVLKLSYGDKEGMVVKENPFYAVSSNSFRGGINSFNWRQELAKAKRAINQESEQSGEEEGGSRNQRSSANQDVVKLLKGEAVLKTNAQTIDQIRDLLEMAQKYGYRMILEQVDEGWLIADELGAAGVWAIITPRATLMPQAGREDTTGGTMELAMHLEKAGVPFAINAQSARVTLGGMAGRDLQGLPLQAMFAVSGGCSEKRALEALTIVPARMMGLEDRIGSIEAGKDADILIMDGHPLDYRTYVEKAIVNGKMCYDRATARILPVFDRSLYNLPVIIDRDKK
ncbi:MAG: amidohydrolase family protein [Planctomycetes bacterium]|nr:amidohydrolase family protein [Planctomycetota bacterium]